MTLACRTPTRTLVDVTPELLFLQSDTVCACVRRGPSSSNLSLLVCLRWAPCCLFDALLPPSQVASALQPLDSSVHYLDSASGGPSSTVSRLLLGLPRPLVVVNVSTVLDDIPRRVCEVTSIQVQGSSSLGSATGPGSLGAYGL